MIGQRESEMQSKCANAEIFCEKQNEKPTSYINIHDRRMCATGWAKRSKRRIMAILNVTFYMWKKRRKYLPWIKFHKTPISNNENVQLIHELDVYSRTHTRTYAQDIINKINNSSTNNNSHWCYVILVVGILIECDWFCKMVGKIENRMKLSFSPLLSRCHVQMDGIINKEEWIIVVCYNVVQCIKCVHIT